MYSVCRSASLSVCLLVCLCLYVRLCVKCRKLKFSSGSKQTLGATCGQHASQPWPAICPDPAAAAPAEAEAEAAIAGRTVGKLVRQARSRPCLCAACCETDTQKPKCFYCISALTYGPILPGIFIYTICIWNTYIYGTLCVPLCACVRVSI